MADRRNLQKYPPILFDEARRREFVDPESMIGEVGLKAGQTVADFGAGGGFFAIPAAHAVGRKGTVYAIDINPNNLAIIHGKSRHQSVASRVKLIEGNVETGDGLTIKEGSLDVVVLSSVLSQFKRREAVIEQARRLLKPAGRLVIFEWHDRAMLLGPPSRARVAKEELINLLFEGNRWRMVSDLEAGFYNYCLIFEPRPDGRDQRRVRKATAAVSRRKPVAKAAK